jgi:hypothetical protein
MRDRLKSFSAEQRGRRWRGESINESFGSGTILGGATDACCEYRVELELRR